MAKKELTAEKQGKVYRVTAEGQQVGPWAAPAAFSEYGFAAQHPIPDTAQAKASIDADTYHDDLLWRLEQLGHIVEDPNAVPTAVEAGPHTAVANQSIRDSVTQHVQTRAVREAAGQEDHRQRTADNKAAAPAVAERPVVDARERTPHRSVEKPGK